MIPAITIVQRYDTFVLQGPHPVPALLEFDMLDVLEPFLGLQANEETRWAAEVNLQFWLKDRVRARDLRWDPLQGWRYLL